MNSSELVSLDAVWLGYFEYNSSYFHCCDELIRSASLITAFIYLPDFERDGTVRALFLSINNTQELIRPLLTPTAR